MDSQSIKPKRLLEKRLYETPEKPRCSCPSCFNDGTIIYLLHKNTHRFLASEASAHSSMYSTASPMFIRRQDILYIQQQPWYFSNSCNHASQQIQSIETSLAKNIYTQFIQIQTLSNNMVSHYLNTLHHYRAIYLPCINLII